MAGVGMLAAPTHLRERDEWGNRRLLMDGPGSGDGKEVKGPALRFAIGRATLQFSMRVRD